VCGIVGTYDIAVDAGRWAAMSDALAHRGPDAAGTWTDPDDAERVRLGHRRLSIIDLSAAANQPFVPKPPNVPKAPKEPKARKERVPKPPKVRRKDRRRVGDEQAVRDAARIGGSPWCPHATRVADRNDGRRARGRDWRDSRPLGRLRHEYRRTGDRCHNRRTVIFRLWSGR
jgi:hypothetical protein